MKIPFLKSRLTFSTYYIKKENPVKDVKAAIEHGVEGLETSPRLFPSVFSLGLLARKQPSH